MDATPRKIEIFAPFGQAMDLTKLILFQPFDISKWLVIGFAAFLAHLGGGGGGNGFNYRKGWPGKGTWSFRTTSHDMMGSASGMPGWMIPLIIIGVLMFVALVVVLMWVGSRGRFIFTDCIVRNRGAIVEPWKEFRKEGNSLFLFSLLVAFAFLVLIGLAAIPLLLPFMRHDDLPIGGALIGLMALPITVFLVVAVGWMTIAKFMIPVMYRRRCGALEGFHGALALVTADIGAVILYLLFSLVLGIAFILVACLLTCVTCCITAIPYVGTVILLPVHVFFMAFLLLFARQFGPDYDAWGNIAATIPATPAIDGPPSAPQPPLSPEAPPSPEPPPFQG